MFGRPAYPGAAIRQQRLTRGDEFGDVRIMDYGTDSKERYRVAAFCPGYELGYIGDTPKMNPDFDHWCNSLDEANAMFDVYLDRERSYGWT